LLNDIKEAEEIEYDSDGVPIGVKEKKPIEPLPPVDHSTIRYNPFEKNLYKEHP